MDVNQLCSTKLDEWPVVGVAVWLWVLEGVAVNHRRERWLCNAPPAVLSYMQTKPCVFVCACACALRATNVWWSVVLQGPTNSRPLLALQETTKNNRHWMIPVDNRAILYT